MLENVPCLVVQFLYLNSVDGDVFADGLSITVLAMFFSALSAAFGALAITVRLFHVFLDSRHAFIGNGVNSIELKFSITSASIRGYHIHSRIVLSAALRLGLKLQRPQIKIRQIRKISN